MKILKGNNKEGIRKNLIMVINEDRFFLSHRRQIGEAALQMGFKVYILTLNTGLRSVIQDLGFEFVELPIHPAGTNPFQEWKLFRFLYKFYRRHPHSLLFHVGVKNIIWGGLAARLLGMKGVVAAVSGLGSLYDIDRHFPPRRLINFLMRVGMKRESVRVIFQNKSDLNELLESDVLYKGSARFTNGSGIDLQEVQYSPEPENGKMMVIFSGRMLRTKGVLDLIEAAEILRARWKGKVEIKICGDFSENPTSLEINQISAHCDGHFIKWLGQRNDILYMLQSSVLMVYPSFYREGVPKSLIEAAAVGRPIITTRSVGCDSTVEEGVNGFKVDPHNVREIASKVDKLLENKELRLNMGKASRKLAEKIFDVRDVVNTHIEVFQELSYKYL